MMKMHPTPTYAVHFSVIILMKQRQKHFLPRLVVTSKAIEFESGTVWHSSTR